MSLPHIRSRLRRLARDERGAVVVEFALILPLFLLFIFAVMEFARGYQALNAITSAAREGARVASVMPDPVGADAYDSVKVRATNIAASMFTTDTIVVAQPVCDKAPPDCRLVTVATSMKMTGVTPLLAMFGYKDGLPLNGTATFRWERAEQPAAPAPAP